MFDFLTLSVVIDDAIFCVHGGLSPSIHCIDQIKVIDRFREIPHEGPMADLVWSDPDPDKEEFAISPRGAGYTFGASIVRKFLEINAMNHVLRAHQLCMEGFSVMYDDRLSTVWSAPNYCYRCGNAASILEISPDGRRFFNVSCRGFRGHLLPYSSVMSHSPRRSLTRHLKTNATDQIKLKHRLRKQSRTFYRRRKAQRIKGCNNTFLFLRHFMTNKQTPAFYERPI